MKNLVKKLHTKTTKYTLVALVLLLGLGVGTYASAELLNKNGGEVSTFQLSPKSIAENLGELSPSSEANIFSNTYGLIFRVFGTTILDRLSVFGDTAVLYLNIGFDTLQSQTTSLQVNGSIKIEHLAADPSAPEQREVCVDDFGKLTDICLN